MDLELAPGNPSPPRAAPAAARPDVTVSSAALTEDAGSLQAHVSPPLPTPPGWRGTLPAAFVESERAAGGQVAFVSADWQEQACVRVDSASALVCRLERVASTLQDQAGTAAFGVRDNGAIFHVVTDRDAYLRVCPPAATYPPRLQEAVEQHFAERARSAEGRPSASPTSGPPGPGRGDLLALDDRDLKRELRIYELIDEAKRTNGPITVDVYVWRWKGLGVVLGGRVGHVMVTEGGTDNVLLSQFPHGLGEPQTSKGPNLKLSFETTFALEGAPGPELYRVTVPSAKAFLDTIVAERGRKNWDFVYNSPEDTHCAWSSFDALRAGGLPIEHTSSQILPGQLGDMLKSLSTTKGEHRWKVEQLKS